MLFYIRLELRNFHKSANFVDKYTKMQSPPKNLISESNYRKLFETSRDGILILDAATLQIIDANPRIIELLDSSFDDLSDKNIDNICKFERFNKTFDVVHELQVNGSVHFNDLGLRTLTGKLFDVEFIANIYNDSGRNFIQCNMRDNSEIQRIRTSTSKKTRILAQIAGKVARLGGWYIKLPERTLTWSDENCIIHDSLPGYQPTLDEGISLYPKEHQARVKEYVEKCAADGTPYDFELPKYTNTGRLIWVRSIGEAVRDEEGNIIGLQGAFQDITERKQVEAEKEKLIEELREVIAEVKTLKQFLPLCSYCRKVRDDQNYWSEIENYISKQTGTKFSHGICPECYESNVVPQLAEFKKKTSPFRES